eukprot:TRINITY_DN1655_c0_g1_i1.p1 TRINITY_DN1655_c0_g1~~TRINITY_DN1655_c0_g1_i1.p1  ORF type:complete len:597 (+),score=224.73 TRINITY_DN1655_c0_g1_i1:141-1931(+)
MSLCGCIPICRCLDQGEQYYGDGCTQKKVWNGPGVICIGPCYKGKRREALTLLKTEYIRVRNTINGEERVEKGPQVLFLGAFDTCIDRAPIEGQILGPIDYLKIKDRNTGEVTIVQGPKLWIPSNPYEELVKKYTAVALKHFEYIKIVDKKTGAQRVEKGEGLFWLGPHEEFVDGDDAKAVKSAVMVDEHTAVLVRDTTNGQLRLVTDKKLYFPGPFDEIVKVQKKIVLEDHQVVVLKDKDGKYIIKEGRNRNTSKEEVLPQQNIELNAVTDSPKKRKEKKGAKDEIKKEESKVSLYLDESTTSFFIPPYCELVGLNWYTSQDLKHKEERVTHFDLRPQFMTYDFVCRTSDNVELDIELTFFWEIVDVKMMIGKTNDLPGDVCNHARSVIIQEISQVTMEKFMAEFNTIIAKAVLERPDTFYSDRGCKVHTVEVRAIHCKDPNTEKVLQEIIKETTDRLNRLQKQASENEVRLYRMKGDIDAEKMNGDLLKIKHDHTRAAALMDGEAQADQIRAFMKGLDTISIPFDMQIHMWQTLRKLDAVDALSDGNSSMVFTPSDVKLSIGALSSGSNTRTATVKSNMPTGTNIPGQHMNNKV